MKKKLTACFGLTVLLLTFLCGCSIDHNDYGYYEVTKMDYEGITATGDDLVLLGIDSDVINLYLAADGSGYFSFFGDETDLKWYDGTVTMDGAQIRYDKTDNVIVMDTTEGEIEFTRVADEPTV